MTCKIHPIDPVLMHHLILRFDPAQNRLTG